jgi:hypothetical protein
MLWFEVCINHHCKARVQVVNIKGDMNGPCTYDVKCYQTPLLEVSEETGYVGMKKYPNYEFNLTHDRMDGMWKLMELVCAKIHELDTKDD